MFIVHKVCIAGVHSETVRLVKMHSCNPAVRQEHLDKQLRVLLLSPVAALYRSWRRKGLSRAYG